MGREDTMGRSDGKGRERKHTSELLANSTFRVKSLGLCLELVSANMGVGGGGDGAGLAAGGLGADVGVGGLLGRHF